MIAASDGRETIRILSDDIDVFVLLVYWCWKKQLRCSFQMEKWDGSVLDINATVQVLGQKCEGILAVHALTGCDTASYPCGKGKVSALKVLLEHDIPNLELFGEEGASYEDLFEAGTRYFLALYGCKKFTSLVEARQSLFCRRKTPPDLKLLPPTDSNLKLHIKHAHFQTALWKSACN